MGSFARQKAQQTDLFCLLCFFFLYVITHPDKSLQMDGALMEILYKKYYETMENGHVLVYDDVLENEFLDV